jgi:hypothetical protein
VTEGAVYVYGVITAAAAASLPDTGVEGSPVRAVGEGDLAALVSDVAGGALAAAREVRAHWKVLEQISAATTVLPVRFGTVMAGDDAVREELLAANADRFAAQLRELDGRVQVVVRGTYAEEDLLRGIVSRSPKVAALRERLQRLPHDAGYYERIRLGELVAAEVDRVREADAAHALARLEPLATATRSEGLGTPDAAFNFAFLVDRARLDDFSAAVTDVIADLTDRITVRYVGPLAPYSFADAELSAGAA